MFGTRELLLVLVTASLVLNIAVVLQRRGRAAVGFVALLGADLALAGAALAFDSRGLFFVLAVGGFAALVVVPSLLGLATRWAVRRGEYGRAMRFLELRQLLQPGLGLERERQMLAGLALVTQGRGEEAIRVAQHQLDQERLEGPMRRVILERLITLLVVERRFDDAFELFEREGGAVLASQSPGICVTMVRAFGERGDFEQATRCQAVLENSPAALDPGVASVVNGARLSYLAHLGRVDELSPLLAESAPFMPGATPQRRMLWRGVALSRAGHEDEARVLWQRVAADDELDPQAAEIARWRLEEAEEVLAPDPLPEAAASLVEVVHARAAAYHAVPRPRGGLLRTAPFTVLLLVAIVLVHGALALFGGGKSEPLDPWLLLRFGANFPVVSLSAEPWRLYASMFLHVNLLHLLTNAVGLYLLGRFTEQLFGPWRFWTIYALGGLVGAATSAKLGGGLLSVGASGAIFGLLGAALVGLHSLRGQVPDAWRRQLSINLLIVIGLQIAIGFRFAMIDNAAHFGGLFGGFVVAWTLGVKRRGAGQDAPVGVRMRLRGIAAVAFGVALILAALGAGIQTSRASLEQLLAHIPKKTVARVGLRARCPKHWYIADMRRGLALHDPLLSLAPALVILPPESLPRLTPQRLAKIAAEGTRQYVAQLRREKGLRDLSVKTAHPVAIASDVMRSELRVLVGKRLRQELLYFKLRDNVLITIVARVAPREASAYRATFDAVAKSTWLADPSARRVPAQSSSSSPGK